jgi:hypothetical protein
MKQIARISPLVDSRGQHGAYRVFLKTKA